MFVSRLSSPLFSLGFILFFGSSCPSLAAYRIMIDPGHGGVDTGATRGMAKEADIALKVGLQLRELLQGDSQFEAHMTRTSNQAVSLNERVQMATKAKVDLFISIHVNANHDPRARGMELYFQNHLPPDEETMFLASTENQGPKSASEISTDLEPTKRNDVSSIVEDLRRHSRMIASHHLSVDILKAWQTENANIRQAPFYVLARASVPSVLVELGFITNAREADKLTQTSFQKDAALKIYHGLQEYVRDHDKSVDTQNSLLGKN